MADVTITGLPNASTLTGAERVPMDQGGTTVDATVSAIAALATKATVGLGNVDNTSDANKPISTATQEALNAKAAAGAIGSSGLTMTAGVLGQSGTGAPVVLTLNGLSIVNGVLTVTAGGSGTVTSVGLSVPTGFTVIGSPITSSGTLALTFAAGYSLPTDTRQGLWDTAYAERLYWDGSSTGLSAVVGRASLGLGNVDNTSDANKPISTATQVALDAKASTGAIGSSGLTMTAGVLGRESGTGAPVVLTLSGLSIVAGVLTVTAGGSGTVTSVAMSVPTGFSVAGSPITSSGTLALTFAAGYSLPPTASQASWDVAAALAATAVQPAGLTSYVQTSDARLSDSREWSAATVDQATAEAGISATRVAYTPLRVFQSIAAWWAASAFKTKLDGIANNATSNATDAQLRDRSTHTGTQSVGTISGLGTGVATALAVNTGAAGAPVLFNDAGGTPSALSLINATGLPLTTGVTGILPVANGGTGTATPGLVQGTNVTITGTWPNQTINATGGGGGGGGGGDSLNPFLLIGA